MFANATPIMNSQNEIWDSRALPLEKKTSVPFIVWVVLISTGFAMFGGKTFIGRNVAGLAWVVCLLFSIWTIIKHHNRIRFPFWIWVPWIFLLLIHLSLSNYPALHRTVQLMCPLAAGMAVSTFNISRGPLNRFFDLCRKFAIIIIFIPLLKTGTLITGIIPSTTGLAAEVMTAILLCNLFAVTYSFGNKKEILRWGLMAALPVFAVTRSAIVTAGLTLPVTMGPLGLRKRLVFLVAGILIGLSLFYSPRIQNKMFRSGEGQIEDILSGSKNLDDSGRYFMWDWFMFKIRQKPWLGHGTGSGEAFVIASIGSIVRYPHNDWLLTLHDQGILGTVIYSLSIIIASFHAWYRSRKVTGETRVLFLAGASSFISLALMMLTDNIMVYASFYGNLQFTILGLAYASAGTQNIEDNLRHYENTPRP